MSMSCAMETRSLRNVCGALYSGLLISLASPLFGVTPEDREQAEDAVRLATEITFAPMKPQFDRYDPVAFRMRIANHGTRTLKFRSATMNTDGATSSPQMFGVNIRTESGTTISLRARTQEPADDTPSTAMPDFRSPICTTVPPGGEWETTVSLDGSSCPGNLIFEKEGKYTVQADLPMSYFDGSAGTREKALEASNQALVSKEAEFRIAVAPVPGERVYFDALSWWETIRLSLAPDGRFVYRFFSDAGGSRPPVKGVYRETSGTIDLDAEINANQFDFIKRRVWCKVHYGRWDLLMPEDLAAKYQPGTEPQHFPVLFEIDPQTTSGALVERPWKRERRGPSS